MAALIGHGRAALAVVRFQYHAAHIWVSANSQVRPVGEPCQMAPPAITSRTPKTDALMMQRRRQRNHARVFNVRRASLSDGRLPPLASIDCKMSRDRLWGTVAAAQPSAAHAEASAPGSTGARRFPN